LKQAVLNRICFDISRYFTWLRAYNQKEQSAGEIPNFEWF
jgi:hypothetical protein